MQLCHRNEPKNASLQEILDRILGGIIVFAPSARLQLGTTDLTRDAVHVVLAPERRRKAFIIPAPRPKHAKPLRIAH